MHAFRRAGLTQADQDILARAAKRGQQDVRTALARAAHDDYRVMEQAEQDRTRYRWSPHDRIDNEIKFQAWLDTHDTPGCTSDICECCEYE